MVSSRSIWNGLAFCIDFFDVDIWRWCRYSIALCVETAVIYLLHTIQFKLVHFSRQNLYSSYNTQAVVCCNIHYFGNCLISVHIRPQMKPTEIRLKFLLCEKHLYDDVNGVGFLSLSLPLSIISCCSTLLIHISTLPSTFIGCCFCCCWRYHCQ